jgi:hypothetical protein
MNFDGATVNAMPAPTYRLAITTSNTRTHTTTNTTNHMQNQLFFLRRTVGLIFFCRSRISKLTRGGGPALLRFKAGSSRFILTYVSIVILPPSHEVKLTDVSRIRTNLHRHSVNQLVSVRVRKNHSTHTGGCKPH